MASDRLAELLRATGEFTDEEVDSMTENDAWEWIHATQSTPEKADNRLMEHGKT
jgi:hypothetical protein